MAKYFTPFSLRIEEGTLDKVKWIAQKEKRSANRQIELILEKFLEEYEAENGAIQPDAAD